MVKAKHAQPAKRVVVYINTHLEKPPKNCMKCPYIEQTILQDIICRITGKSLKINYDSRDEDCQIKEGEIEDGNS